MSWTTLGVLAWFTIYFFHKWSTYVLKKSLLTLQTLQKFTTGAQCISISPFFSYKSRTYSINSLKVGTVFLCLYIFFGKLRYFSRIFWDILSWKDPLKDCRILSLKPKNKNLWTRGYVVILGARACIFRQTFALIKLEGMAGLKLKYIAMFSIVLEQYMTVAVHPLLDPNIEKTLLN